MVHVLGPVALVAALLPCGVLAQVAAPGAADYPARAVRVIVSYGTGGATDIMARLVALKLSEYLRRPFVVENRSGAMGVLGDQMVAKAPPDGYTLLGTSSSYAINPAVIASLPYDPVKDFAAISMVAQAPFLLVVHPALPSRSVKELIMLARANPGKLDFASAGEGSAVHLAVALFNSMARITMTQIPYRSSGEGLVSLLGGQVQLTFAGILSSGQYVKAGKLRALAVSGTDRSSMLPDLPTVAEAGVPGYEVVSWYGWLAPAGTPAAVIGKLNAAIVKIVNMPDVNNRLLADGAEPVASSSERFADRLAAEIARWRTLVRDTGMSPK